MTKQLGSIQSTASALVAKSRIRTYPFVYERPDQLPDDYREALIRLLIVQLSSEYQDRSRRPIAPTPYWVDDVGIQFRGETEHGRGLADILRTLGIDPLPWIEKAQNASADAKLLDVFRHIIFQEGNKKTSDRAWLSVGIGRWLVERGGGYQSIAALGSTYLPWAAWSARNFKDEGFEHSSSGNRIVEEAIAAGQAPLVQEMFDTLWPHAVDMFGANDFPNLTKYLETGIKTIGNREVRLAWFAHVQADAALMGVRLPANPLKGKRGNYAD